MTMTTLWRIEIDEPIVVGIRDTPSELVEVQSHDFGVVVVKAEVVVVVAPRLVVVLLLTLTFEERKYIQ